MSAENSIKFDIDEDSQIWGRRIVMGKGEEVPPCKFDVDEEFV